jgi:hypothetical protein
MRRLDKTFIAAGIFSLALLIGITSCKFDFRTNEESNPTKQQIEMNLSGHRWRISNIDEKGKLVQKAYNLEFLNDGMIVAENDRQTINGTWMVFNSSNQLLKLNLEFDNSFEPLNDDWVVVESTDHKLILQGKGDWVSQSMARIILEKV